MNTSNAIIIVGALAMVGLLAFVISTTLTTPTGANIQAPITETLQAKLTGTTEQGDVAIELKPHKASGNELSVDISVNTHSVDLSQHDLTEITTLEYNGKIVKPTSAPSLGGHHISGILVFPVKEMPETFMIKINGIPSVQERVFEWR